MYRIITMFTLLLVTRCNLVKSTENEFANSLEEAKEAISKSNITYWQAFVRGDSSLFIERYATDACILVPNSLAMCGPNAAQDFYNIAYNRIKIRDGKFITTEVFGGGEFVTEYGLFELRDSANALIDNGKYLVLWKRTNQGWKMFRDSFSSNTVIQ